MLSHLTSEEARLYRQAIRGDHTIEPVIEIHDTRGNVLRTLRGMVVDGQVDIVAATAADEAVESSMQATLVDVDHLLGLDDDSDNESALNLARRVYVEQVVRSQEAPGGIRIPMFKGVPFKPSRQGPTFTLEAQGMEVLGLGAAWEPRTWPRGTFKHQIIREVLTDYMGLDRFVIPRRPSRIPKDLTMGRRAQPWVFAKVLAESMAMQLYMPVGVPVMRSLPGRVAWSFDERSLTSLPKISPDTSTLANAASVSGVKPEGARRAVVSRRVAPRNHALAPARIGEGDASWYRAAFVDNDTIRCQEDADALSKQTLREGLRQLVSVEASSIPVYHLHPLDLASIQGGGVARDFRIQSLSIPLAATGDMSVGYTRKVTPTRRLA